MQEHIAVIQFIAPDGDGLEGERALAQAGDHRLAAGLNTLGDGDLALARESHARPKRSGGPLYRKGLMDLLTLAKRKAVVISSQRRARSFERGAPASC